MCIHTFDYIVRYVTELDIKKLFINIIREKTKFMYIILNEYIIIYNIYVFIANSSL